METATILNILFGLAVIFFVYRLVAPIKGVRTVSARAFKQELETTRDALLIDVREPHEFKAGHIPGAKNLPLSQLQSKWNELPEGKPVLVYCQSGMRSKRAAAMLRRKGIADIVNLQGGIMAWHRDRAART